MSFPTVMIITHNDSAFDLQGPYKSDRVLVVSWRLCCQGVLICSDANIFIGNIIYELNFFQFSLFWSFLSVIQAIKIINIFNEN